MITFYCILIAVSIAFSIGLDIYAIIELNSKNKNK